MGLPLVISRFERALLRENARTGLMAVRLNTVAAEALFVMQRDGLEYVRFGDAITYVGYKGAVFSSLRETKLLYSTPLSLDDWLDVSLWSLQLIRKGVRVKISA